MLLSFLIYLEGEDYKGYKERKVRFREGVRVLCDSRIWDEVKQYRDSIHFCEIIGS